MLRDAQCVGVALCVRLGFLEEMHTSTQKLSRSLLEKAPTLALPSAQPVPCVAS
jgi:hypothetical protein